MDQDQPTQNPTKSNKLNLSVDLRAIIFLLLVVIAGMVLLWKPWAATTSGKSDQVVTVTGESKVTAAPDEFVFYPTYEFKNASKETALAALTKQNEELVAKLKALGVADNKIKTNSDGYDNYYYDQSSGQNNYTLRLTVTVGDKKLAEKVQNYLVSTAPTGAVSPQASFSDKKRKQLENTARDAATKDARSKAEQSAKNLNFTVGKVKSVKDGTGFGGATPLYGRAESTPAIAADTTNSNLSIQSGENDLTYSVEVVYYVR
ncbi:MAG: hypothetical protein JWO35_362 [Candidatus Saccharibacteria bacterium]|nr:hypothetical protein [Candidatus Saccharibacteria bacterium]